MRDQNKMDAKFFQNCCSKGKRSYAPYQGTWPYTLWFGPVDRRMDQWQKAFDPTTYPQGRYVCWQDSTNIGCLDISKNAYTLPYYLQRLEYNDTRPFGKNVY